MEGGVRWLVGLMRPVFLTSVIILAELTSVGGKKIKRFELVQGDERRQIRWTR